MALARRLRSMWPKRFDANELRQIRQASRASVRSGCRDTRRRTRVSRWTYTPTACDSTNCGTCRPSTSPATRTHRSPGRYGVVKVRYGKAKKAPHPNAAPCSWSSTGHRTSSATGSPTVSPTSATASTNSPASAGALVAERTLLRRFRRYCNDLELSAGLDPHSFRRSYITHLIEDGWDAKFVQDQAGHEYASTTSLYTGVSSDFRTRTLRRVLDRTIKDALSFDEETS